MPKPLAFEVDSVASGNFNFFLPLSKIDKDKRTVSGYASTPAIDLDGEIVSLKAVKAALPGYWAWRNIREMHTTSAVGVAKEANVDDKGLFLTAKIVDDDAWNKCIEGVYKGFSIGGKKLAKTGNTITEIELIEVSVVDRPANPECRFEVQKSAKAAGEAYLMKVKSTKEPSAKALEHMAKAVTALSKAGPPAAHDGFSLPAKIRTKAKCAKHDVEGCPECACEAHSLVDCTECAKIGKREFNTSERQSAASSGAALPDGSFPIENASDLKNAIQAFGRAKNPSEAKAHIRSRAKALGKTDLIPDEWKSAKKIAKRLAKAEAQAEILSIPMSSPASSFLTLNGDVSRGDVSESRVELRHELDLGYRSLPQKDGNEIRFSKREKKLLKRMGVAGSLSYCFDSIRDAQRSLMLEAKREGGDMKDKALAAKLGSVAESLAEVIGQKAIHEGAEARDLSDADDQWLVTSLGEDFEMSAKVAGSGGDPFETLLTEMFGKAAGKSAMTPAMRMAMAKKGLKKARKSASSLEECIKSAHAMHKSAYLSKAAKGKKDEPGNDDFDHRGAMEKLNKAHSDLQMVKTLMKGASEQLKKVSRAGEQGQETGDSEGGFYEVPTGVKDLDPDHMATLSPGSTESGSMPPVLGMEHPFPGKSAKTAGRGRGVQVVSAREAELMAKVAAAEAESNILKSMPAANGRKPYAFDVSKLGIGNGADSSDLFKGVRAESLVSDNEQVRKTAVGTVIGNMILGGKGQSLFDSNFHGTAGG